MVRITVLILAMSALAACASAPQAPFTRADIEAASASRLR